MKKRLIVWGLVALLVGSFFGFGNVGAENSIWIERANSCSIFRLTTTILNTAHTWVSSQTFTTVDINGGTVDATTVGASTPAAGAFTTVKATTGAATSKVFTSDASGNATWEDAPTGTLPNPTTNIGAMLEGSGTSTFGVVTAVPKLVAMMTNPKAMSQGVHMTAAASGSNGIAVADDDDIDFGTGDFTLVWRGSLPDWTPVGATPRLFYKYQNADNRWAFTVGADGKVYVFAIAGAATIFTNTFSDTNAFIDGTSHEVVVVITRETASTAGSAVYYFDGVLAGTSAWSAAATVAINNSGTLEIMGGIGRRYASSIHSTYTYNRALTAAQVLSLYRNGVDFFDKYGNQTSLNLATLANSGTSAYDTFDGASTTAFHAVTDGSDVARASTTDAISYVSGYKYEVSFTSSAVTGTAPTYGPAKDGDGTALTGGVQTNTVAEGLNTYEFTAGETATGTVVWSNTAASSEYTISLFSITKLGATLALESEGIQPSPGQWLDSSGNKLHAKMPATGASLVRSERDFTVKWTNSWSGTNELQYIGGINESILPTDCYITSIIGVISGTTIEDVTVGDGADADRFVTITTGLAAGTTSFTVANPISDATNYDLTVTPDAAFTGSIRWTISGIVL